MKPAISVIIPCYNEADAIERTLVRVMHTYRLETSPNVYVIDAGRDYDGTEKIVLDVAAKFQHLVSYTHLDKPSRGRQLMYGADLANTPFLLFLHADTLLPVGWDVAIIDFFRRKDSIQPLLGCFQLALAQPLSLSLRIMVWTANVRAALFKLPYGDQAYFVRRRDYQEVGGFADIPLMEDVDLLRRYKHAYANTARQQKARKFSYWSIIQEVLTSSLISHIYSPRCIQMIPMSVITSPRRWNRKGVWRNTLCNQFYMSAWLLGVSPTTIYEWYYGKRVASL